MKIAERYTIKNEHKNGNIYAIITETKDGKYFVATDCGENGDKCGEWKVCETYKEAKDFLREKGYWMSLYKLIDVDESIGENTTMSKTAKLTYQKPFILRMTTETLQKCRIGNPKVVNGGNSQDSNRVYCPVFGGWIMRYDACRGGCEYDSETDTCKLYRNNTQKGGDV